MTTQSNQIPRFGIIIGAMKAGTTAAFQALGQHIEVALSRTKEPNYFATNETFSKGLDEYQALWNWEDIRHKIAVEASTNLTKEPTFSGGAARMASIGRDIRLVYLVREPISRIQSQYIMHAAKGWSITPLSEGVDEQALNYSRYHFQITKYAGTFSRSKILILAYDELVARPQATMDQLCHHFGLSTTPLHVPKTNSTKARYMRPLLIQSLLAQGIEVEDTSISGFGRWFNQLPSKVRMPAFNRVAQQVILTENHCSYIKARLADDMRALNQEFGIDVSAWGF